MPGRVVGLSTCAIQELHGAGTQAIKLLLPCITGLDQRFQPPLLGTEDHQDGLNLPSHPPRLVHATPLLGAGSGVMWNTMQDLARITRLPVIEQPFYHRQVAPPDRLTRVWIEAEASLPVGWRVSGMERSADESWRA
jgi:hypothetical protein